MKSGTRFSWAGLAVLLALAGCGRGYLQYGERASWRHQAEVNCLKSGGVKIGTGVVQVSPIDGPGMCGADFPLKVSALGESSAVIGYADELRPPGAVPRGSAGAMPNWPPTESRYAPVATRPVQVEPIQSQPIQGQGMRWVPGPSGIEAPQATAPAGQPMSIAPPGMAPPETTRAAYPPQDSPEADEPDDIPDDVVGPGRGPASAPRTQPAYNAPIYQAPPQLPRPALGPSRPQGPMPAATLTPTATLACPIVSALDRWVSGGVQPAALHWFNSPVVEIKQISAYSCRGMVGSGTNHISEHAFGNALDIAGFIFADGRKIMVKDGWHGSPEEQGFLHDVQLYACDTFNTVLSPGYNAAHYNHIHVDLMRRANGRRPCRPDAVPGEIVAAKARAIYASKGRGPAYTGSIKAPISIGTLIKGLPEAPAGEDGYVADEDADDSNTAVTGSIPAQEPAKKSKSGGWFSGWFGGDSKPARRAEDRLSKNY